MMIVNLLIVNHKTVGYVLILREYGKHALNILNGIIMNKQEFLSASLPYELKCQYEGIIYYKNEVNEDTIFDKEIIPVEQKIGNKIGILKEVHVYKKFWTAKSGIKSLGLKKFYN